MLSKFRSFLQFTLTKFSTHLFSFSENFTAQKKITTEEILNRKLRICAVYNRLVDIAVVFQEFVMLVVMTRSIQSELLAYFNA